MQNDIKKKQGALIAAIVVIAVAVAYLAIFTFGLLDSCESVVLAVVIGVYCLLIVAVIIGVMVALRQRMKEIDSGEEEDAKKY